MPIPKVCNRCQTEQSDTWWKCCAKHTTPTGPDIMCEDCARRLHPDPEDAARVMGMLQLFTEIGTVPASLPEKED